LTCHNVEEGITVLELQEELTGRLQALFMKTKNYKLYSWKQKKHYKVLSRVSL